MHCILVVDDDPAVLDVVSKMLEADGHTVIRTPNSQEAYDIITGGQWRVDLVVADISMPGMDGLTLARLIKAREATQHIKVIHVSELADVISDPAAQPVGGDVCIPKPIDPALLRKTVADLLGRGPEALAAP